MAKVLCILHRWGVQLILAYSWARPAILIAGKGTGGMSLFLLFLHFHFCSSFFPVPLIYLLYYLFSPFLWEITKNCPQGLTCHATPHNQTNKKYLYGFPIRVLRCTIFLITGYSRLPDTTFQSLKSVECLRMNNNRIERYIMQDTHTQTHTCTHTPDTQAFKHINYCEFLFSLLHTNPLDLI